MDARAEFLDFRFEILNIAEIVRFFAFESRQFLFDFAQFGATAARQCNAPGVGRTQGTDDVDPRRVALVADPRTHGLEGICAGQVALDQVGQFEILEHEFEEFFLGDLEDELVHAFAGVAGLARPTAAATSRRTGDVFASGEFLVAGVNHGLLAAATMVKHRFVDIATGDADLLAVLHIGDGTPADRLFDSLLDVVTVTPQEALTVHRALVLAIETSVDHIAHDCSLEAVLQRGERSCSIEPNAKGRTRSPKRFGCCLNLATAFRTPSRGLCSRKCAHRPRADDNRSDRPRFTVIF